MTQHPNNSVGDVLETREQMWARWKAETPLRAKLFNASLPSRDAGLPDGVGGFQRASDRLGYWEGMR